MPIVLISFIVEYAPSAFLGSKLLLTVVDSNGQSGGFNSDFINIVGTFNSGRECLRIPY